MKKNILKRLIDNLSGADLRRVRKDPMEIMGMEHPSEAAQLYVVRQRYNSSARRLKRYSWRWSERMPP